MITAALDSSAFWQHVATVLASAAAWAQQRAHRPEPTEYEKLEEMVRHPVRWTMRNPIIALRKRLDRRRES